MRSIVTGCHEHHMRHKAQPLIRVELTRGLNRSRIAILALAIVCASTNGLGAGDAKTKIAIHRSGWRHDGLICYRSEEGQRIRIHVLRLHGEKVTHVFSKEFGKGVKTPFFCGDAVVTVDVKGLIYKMDVTGSVRFAEKPQGFRGVAGVSGPVSRKCMYVTETVPNEHDRTLRYYLCIIRVDGQRPQIIRRFALRELGFVVVDVADDSIIVVGETQSYRFKLPRCCSQELSTCAK